MDERALADAIVTNRPRLHAVAHRLLGDHHAAEDAVQEASLRALTGLNRFRGQSSVGTWLYRITTNVCLDELRRRRRIVVADPADLGEMPYPVDPADTAVRRADLAAALGALPRPLRDVVVLADVCDLDYTDVGASLGIPSGTVGSRLHAARRALHMGLAA